MLDKLISYKCKASTVLESIVAALILLISLSAGIGIYNKVILTGRSSTAIGATYTQKQLADSLEKTGKFPFGQISRAELNYNIQIADYPAFSDLQILQIITTDRSGKQLAELRRIIPKIHD